jgi:hypothetical protein
VPKPGERGIGAAHAFLFQEPEQVAADVKRIPRIADHGLLGFG